MSRVTHLSLRVADGRASPDGEEGRRKNDDGTDDTAEEARRWTNGDRRGSFRYTGVSEPQAMNDRCNGAASVPRFFQSFHSSFTSVLSSCHSLRADRREVDRVARNGVRDRPNERRVE